MTIETTQIQRDKLNELEKGKLEEVTVYTLELDGYNKWFTVNKEAALKVWLMLTENFFNLENLGSTYEPPHFAYKKPMQAKLVGEKKKIWVSYEDAQRAFNAFTALSPKKSKK